MIDSSLINVSPFETFQFERYGYYVVDKESTENNIIFNEICLLRNKYKK